MKNVNNMGSVSFETSRASYRGFVTIQGRRLATNRYPTRLGARRALNTLIRNNIAGMRISNGVLAV